MVTTPPRLSPPPPPRRSPPCTPTRTPTCCARRRGASTCGCTRRPTPPPCTRMTRACTPTPAGWMWTPPTLQPSRSLPPRRSRVGAARGGGGGAGGDPWRPAAGGGGWVPASLQEAGTWAAAGCRRTKLPPCAPFLPLPRRRLRAGGGADALHPARCGRGAPTRRCVRAAGCLVRAQWPQAHGLRAPAATARSEHLPTVPLGFLVAPGWWHYVKSTATSFSVSFWWR